MGRNPVTRRSKEEQMFRDAWALQHGRSKGASKAWRRKQQRTSGQTAKKTNLVKTTTALALIPGNTVVDHISEPPQVTKSVGDLKTNLHILKVYNATTGKMDNVDPRDVGLFQKMVNAWKSRR